MPCELATDMTEFDDYMCMNLIRDNLTMSDVNIVTFSYAQHCYIYLSPMQGSGASGHRQEERNPI